MRNNKILFYSSVKNVRSFITSGFYANDIKALSSVGFDVQVTNSIFPFFLFWNYDIAFLYFYKKSIIPALISKCFFKKIFFTGGIDELSLNATFNKYELFRQRILFKICYLLSNICNIVSNSDLTNTLMLLNQKPSFNIYKLSYFPHCIDTYSYNSTLVTTKKNLLVSICWMGSIENVKRKGLDRCIYFLNELVKIDSSYKLLIIGTYGEGTFYLKKIISNLNLQDFVDFTGEISENLKNEYLAKSKYYLQFSTYEGFGVAILEAMLYGCYIVHSNVGGLKDTIGENGLIFKDFKNYSSLAKLFINHDINYLNHENILNKNQQTIFDKYSILSRANYFKNNLSTII